VFVQRCAVATAEAEAAMAVGLGHISRTSRTVISQSKQTPIDDTQYPVWSM
jgi:hypothetical protein